MTKAADPTPRTLEVQREEYQKRRFLAMPIAGLIMWTLIGIVGATLSTKYAVWAVWIGAGSIFYLGAFISKFTDENFFDKSKPKNTFDSLFMYTVVMALLVFAIAVPFTAENIASVPFTVGILTGLMWVPFSWAIQHWIGAFHGIARTLLILAAWYLVPQHIFVVVPVIIVILYIITIFVLHTRWRALQ